MHVRMSVWGEPGEQLLASLQNWLQWEPGLRAAPVVRQPAPPGPGRKARPDRDDHLVITLPEEATPALAGALSTWLSTRIGNVRVRVTGPDGTAEISVADIADHPRLLRAALDPDPAGAARSSPGRSATG